MEADGIPETRAQRIGETGAQPIGLTLRLAGDGDTVAGTISLEAGLLSGEERILYLNQLAVAPGCRRKGVGRFLLALAEKRARELGIPRLQLDTAAPAEHLLRFYRRAGYEVVDEVQWPGKTYRSVIMEKRLAER